MTPALLKSSKTRCKLYRAQIKKPKNDTCSTKYVKFRNLFNKLKKVSKQQYYSELLAKYKGDVRKTWDVLNTIIGRKKDKSSTSDIFTVNGNTESNSLKIADCFCKYFTNIGQTLAEQIPTSPISFDKYLTEPNSKSIYLNPTDSNEILTILSKMKGKQSMGHDRLSSQILKQIKNYINKPLAILINRSMAEGTIPDSLKIAKVIPIYKNKDKQIFNNYRPISLLPSTSKILEKVIHKRVYMFLTKYKILSPKQYGFRTHNTPL